ATMRYRLGGAAGGEWWLAVADGTCRVDRAEGGTRRPDVTLEADAEELVAAAQARAAPWVGRLARTVDWVRGPGRAEDVAAAITSPLGAPRPDLLGEIVIQIGETLEIALGMAGRDAGSMRRSRTEARPAA